MEELRGGEEKNQEVRRRGREERSRGGGDSRKWGGGEVRTEKEERR